jgi:integrase
MLWDRHDAARGITDWPPPFVYTRFFTGLRPSEARALRYGTVDLKRGNTNGANLKKLADYCGTSIAMIEQRYGKYLADDADFLGALDEPLTGRLTGRLSRKRLRHLELLENQSERERRGEIRTRCG